MPLVSRPPTIVEKAYVTQGLVGQDDNIDILEAYFKEMQKTTVETSQPELPDDFLTFATCAHFFGVITLETTTIPVADEEVSDDEDFSSPLATPREPPAPSDEIEDSVYPASSRATTPPGSAVSSAASFHTTRLGAPDEISANPSAFEMSIPTMSEQEKVLLWREAFMAKLEQTPDEPIMQEQGVSPIYSSKGKGPEYRSGFFPERAETDPLLNPTQWDEEDVSDLINWPDEGPSDDKTHRQEYAYDPADFPMDISSPQPSQDELGREYLEPEIYTSPAREPVELQPDPQLQAIIYESAVKYQEELRRQTIKEYQRIKRRAQRRAKTPPAPPAEPTKTLAPIGLIYLWSSQAYLDPLHMGECTLGIYIIPEHRGKDCLVDAANEVVDLAFKNPECHRLSSIIVESPEKLYNLELLARAGFRNEGIRRRAFYSHVACEWKDVTYFAMLDTDYVYDKNGNGSDTRLRPKSLWDEVFSRHQEECDNLIRLEEKSSLKRSCSIETIRERVSSAASSAASFYAESERGGDVTDTSLSIRSAASPKRRRTGAHPSQQAGASSSASTASISSGLDSDWEVANHPGPSTQRLFSPCSVDPSSVAGSRPLKGMSAGTRSGSSASSQWSLLSD